MKSLLHFPEMLMRKRLIHRKIVGPPAEMGSLGRLLACTCRTGNSGHVNFCEFIGLCHRQKRQLHCGRKATGIGDMRSLADFSLECFRQTIYKVFRISVKPEIITQINYLSLVAVRQRMDIRL